MVPVLRSRIRLILCWIRGWSTILTTLMADSPYNMKIHRIQCKAWSQAGYNSGGALKGFQRHHLVNALLVAAALKFVVQKGVNDLAGEAGAHNAAA